MTREQQITQASQGRFPEWGEQQHALELAFQAGAMWADSHTNWISVEDELPPLEIVSESWGASDDVLVYTLSHDILVSRYELDKLTQEHYWVFSGHDYIVTHWMPLPSIENLKKGGEQ